MHGAAAALSGRQIGTRAKLTTSASDNDTAHVGICGETAECFGELGPHVTRHGIFALWAINHDRRYGIGPSDFDIGHIETILTRWVLIRTASTKQPHLTMQ
jgi:hypothetical protein